MADDIDMWTMGDDGMLPFLAGSYRMGAATGPNEGDVFPVSLLMHKDSTGRFVAQGGGVNGAALIDATYGAAGVSTTALRATLNSGNGGAYMSGYSAEASFAHNSEFISGSNWVARHTDAARYTQSGGNHDWYGNIGLTAGTGFSPARVLHLNADGTLRPGVDGTNWNGHPAYRWAVVYAVTGTINTCDIRFKTFRADPVPSAAELRAALQSVDELGFFQWDDAIAAKGAEHARWHFGPRAQSVWTIFAAEALCDALIQREPDGDWLPPEGSVTPAFLCFDEWVEEVEERPIYSETLVDGAGHPLQIGTDTIVTRPAGNRFGVRIDQLHSLMIAALNAERLAQATTGEEQAIQIAGLTARLELLEAAA